MKELDQLINYGKRLNPALVAHACNPSYSGGAEIRRIEVERPYLEQQQQQQKKNTQRGLASGSRSAYLASMRSLKP
jgi:hypothetical protein